MEDTITISRAEYDRLVGIAEDAADIRAIEEHRANLARGEEEMIPSEFVDRMLDGESILKLWREHRGHNQTELGRLSGVNRVMIADIEAGRKSGSISSLKKLADALSITVDDLI